MVIVDDEPANVMLLQRLIRAAGVVDVHGVTDPREAVDRCLEVGADLVLLDLIMPDLDGFEVMTALSATSSAETFLPVLVLTADSTIEARDRALRAGANDFLTKPFDQTEVILRVRNLLETRWHYTEVRRHNLVMHSELKRREAAEQHAAKEHRQRLARIKQVLADDAITMVFQPVADLRSGRTLGVEALARFNVEPRRPPHVWFDEAAAVGLGVELELAAVSAAFSRLDELAPDTFLAVNVSPATTSHPGLASLLDDVPADRIVLELTEHVRINDYEPLRATLDDLRERGTRLAVDDAGAGYAGLRHILDLRPDIIKLDVALTRGIDTDPARRALATAMIAFAHELAADVIAEGIETRPELTTLRALDVPWGQGYHLAKPAPTPSIVASPEVFVPSD